MGSKKTPAINSSSTADIAFLLLCYFLMTTTMDTKLGLDRTLPPMPDETQKLEDQKVKRHNIIVVKINSSDKVFAGDRPIYNLDNDDLKETIKRFLKNEYNDPNMPDKEITHIESNGKILGDYPVSKGVISLQNDRGTSYEIYLKVQNELVKAVNELRDEFIETQSKDKSGNGARIFPKAKKFTELTDDDQIAIVKKAVPQIISEAEPKNVNK